MHHLRNDCGPISPTAPTGTYIANLLDYRLFPSVVEMQALMKFYDIDGDGNITYEEFIRGLREELTERRANMIARAFELMDKDGSGILDLNDIKQSYNAKMHPDVKKGKKTEDDILCEFLDTFEMHYSLNHEGSRDGKITMDEWIEYYNNVSMSIDDDKYFELMMNSTWNLDGSRVTKKGWGGEF